VQIDPVPEHLAELILQGEESQTWHVTRLELDQDVDVTVRAKVGAQN
jgi:hypothetical protein